MASGPGPMPRIGSWRRVLRELGGPVFSCSACLIAKMEQEGPEPSHVSQTVAPAPSHVSETLLAASQARMVDQTVCSVLHA